VLHGALHDWFVKHQLRAHVTLSDETDYATSHVIVEQTTA
jgi:holo-[acyl-carrier protein] synthase